MIILALNALGIGGNEITFFRAFFINTGFLSINLVAEHIVRAIFTSSISIHFLGPITFAQNALRSICVVYNMISRTIYAFLIYYSLVFRAFIPRNAFGLIDIWLVDS